MAMICHLDLSFRDLSEPSTLTCCHTHAVSNMILTPYTHPAYVRIRMDFPIPRVFFHEGQDFSHQSAVECLLLARKAERNPNQPPTCFCFCCQLISIPSPPATTRTSGRERAEPGRLTLRAKDTLKGDAYFFLMRAVQVLLWLARRPEAQTFHDLGRANIQIYRGSLQATPCLDASFL